MVIMAVDLGKSRSGIACSDANESMAFPKDVIEEHNTDKLVNKICEKACEYKAGLIVIGLPVNMDGSRGSRAIECENISDMIRKKSGIKTVLWDERCTTVMAHKALNITNTRGKNRKAVIDAVAASMILQEYLDFIKNIN